MIVLNVVCEKEHEFEGWFRSADEFSRHAELGRVECPRCGSTRVARGLSAPHLSGSSREEDDRRQVTAMKPGLSAEQARIRQFLTQLREHVETNFDYVGGEFAAEARRIHHGEADDRAIYGEASGREVRELLEEGISVAPLPQPPEKAN
ncbi:MAG: DUF1178 family protein [Alphaproteobacteria bacterium]|nr:DUF1178 family protein [Alphaproteobacteria bacterium]